MRQSVEVEFILREAEEIARKARRPLSSAHILLGMLTNHNRAKAVLDEFGADAERLVGAMRAVKREEQSLEEGDGVLERIGLRMAESARNTGAPLASSLHLLMALSRERQSVARRVLTRIGVQPHEIRMKVLSRITGPSPRELKRRPPAGDGLFAQEPESHVALEEPPSASPAPAAKAAPGFRPPAYRPSATEPAPGSARAAARDEEAPAELTPPTGYELDPEVFPALTELTRNLTVEAAAGRIDEVIGRADLIEQMIDTLNKRRSNNPCLVGEPGVGKTAIVGGLARAMLEHAEAIEALRDKVIVSLDVGALVAGTQLRGAFSKRMALLKEEVRAADGRIIVFIDELHTLVGAGAGDGPLDAASDLKQALAMGEFPCIGATTPAEYHKYIEKDPALERRFQPLWVPEPSDEESLAILRGSIAAYEAHHNVIYTSEALGAAVRLSRRFLVERQLPDKAFGLIDAAAARAVRHGKESVEASDIAEIVSKQARIPLDRLTMSDGERILGLRDRLGERIVGHGDILDTIAEVIQRASAGFASERPLGSFLFLGPTGVGKTETAKALTVCLFGSEEAMTRFDMSEFSEAHAKSRLLGAPPGYQGHEEAPGLTAALTRRPYQLILFDEIEKAHPDVLTILLQILDEGRLTDSQGRQLRFANTVVILTSNLGSETLRGGGRRGIGFAHKDEAAGDGPAFTEEDRRRFLEAAREGLLPELWGRIEDKCVYAPLSRRDVSEIAHLLAASSSSRLEEDKRIGFRITEAVVEHLVAEGGYDRRHGARPMRRTFKRIVEGFVATAILRGMAGPDTTLYLDMDEGELTVARVERSEAT